MKKYLRTCGHCARCVRCMHAHAGVICRNYKPLPACDDIIIDKAFVDDAPATAPAEERVRLVDYLGDTAPAGDPAPAYVPATATAHAEEHVDPIVPDDYGDYDSFIAALLADDNHFYVLSFWGANTNSFYDPDRTYNGGGYWQPSGGCLIAVSGRLVVVEYDKFDCGDFGCRRSYAVECDGFRWTWRESNMDGDRDDDRDEIYNSISGVLDVDAEWLLDVARDAVQFAASETWHSRDDGEVPAV